MDIKEFIIFGLLSMFKRYGYVLFVKKENALYNKFI